MAFNQKNPPWQRNTGQNISGMQTIVSLAQPVFNQSLGIQQQLIPQMGMQQQIYSQTVQYPTSRPLNALSFPSQPQTQASPQVNRGGSKFNPNERVFSGTGHVTKVQNDFGFIDEEVFFHKNVCKGQFPKVGDRVLVEASYNQNMPFKWNAARVQVLQSSNSSANSSTSSRHLSTGYSGQNSGERSGRSRYSPPRKSPDRHGHRSSNHDSRQRQIDDDDERRRYRDERDSDRYREKQRDRTPDRDRRDRSPIRKLSPKRRKVRTIPRYMVQINKQLLTLKKVDILELRRRYSNLYIPSDFFLSETSWVDAFPPNEPFSIKKPCAFHVMHRDVEPLYPNDTNLEPVDADYLYSAKVMLMSTPPMTDFYQKCFATAEERERYDDEKDLVHPTRLINFLVGIRGKNETMAIGGPWSPSLDGANPHSNPNVLIKTAIRTCKGLTGIDLSKCTRWYRFVELYYRRSETYHKGRLIPARVETVVIFLPDVRSCQPTRPEWEELNVSYKSHLERIINSQNSDSPIPAESSAGGEAVVANVSSDGEKTTTTLSTENTTVADSNQSETKATKIEKESSESTQASTDTVEKAAEDSEKEDTVTSKTESDEKKSPKLTIQDIKKMKVADLKTELQARNLQTDGVKNVLITRLTKAIKEENTNSGEKAGEDEELNEENEEQTETTITTDPEKTAEKEDEEFETMENVDMSEVTVIDEYDSTKCDEKSNDENASKKQERVKLTEKERQLLEKRYTLPELPHIIVHPSRTAKSGKFDCAVMSLSVLLDYRPEDSKEHSFEVSLFAELFNEMLTRDFGFNIYKALHLLPVKKDEESKKETNEEGKDAEDKKVNGEENKDKEKDPEPEAKSKDEKDEKEKDKTRDRDSRKRSRFDDVSEEDRRRREKDKEKERVKYCTVDRELLLACTYFDVSHCGYIFDRDIEDLFYTLGLNLSRSQIRKVVSKAITRDSLYYRKLTDKPKEDEEKEVKEETKKEKDVEVVEKEEPSESKTKVEDEVAPEISESELAEIALGNSNYLEQLKCNLQAVLESVAEEADGPPTKKLKVEETEDENEIPNTKNGLVVHNSGVLDIPKLLEQIKRSEKSLEGIEQTVVDLRRHNHDLQRSNNRAVEKIKDQSADIKSLTRKLIDSEQNVRELSKKSNEYFSTLSSVYDRVSVVVHRAEAKRSSSITSSKRGSSRDRLARKDRKSKEKDAEPSKTEEKKTEDLEVEIIADSKEPVNENKTCEADKSDNKIVEEKKESTADEKKE